MAHRREGGWFYATHVNEHRSIYSGGRLVLPAYSDSEKSLSVFHLGPFVIVQLVIHAVFPTPFFRERLGLAQLTATLAVIPKRNVSVTLSPHGPVWLHFEFRSSLARRAAPNG